MPNKNVAVLVSGNGSNLQALIDSNINSANISVVISNKPEAYAVQRAKNHGISFEIIDHKEYGSRQEFEKRMIETLETHNIELVVLAGFMRVLTPYFVNHYKNRIINIHPALLPSFPGVNSPKQALDYGVKITGCTVHFVDDGVDTGPIILQSAVYIENEDNEETLSAKIHSEEHRILPESVRLFCEDKLIVEGRRVIIK